MEPGVIRRADLKKRFPEDWEAAARMSKQKKAVGETVIDDRGHLRTVEIIKPLEGDATINYSKSGVVIRKATSREIDSCKRWKPF